MHEVLFHRLLIIISLNFNGICMLLSLRHIIHGLTFLALPGERTRGCKRTHFGQGLEQEIDEVQQHMQLL